MTAALAWAAQHGAGQRITCIIRPNHAASHHVAGKLGFTGIARGVYAGSPVVLLRPKKRCVVPFTSFLEFNEAAGGDIWFASTRAAHSPSSPACTCPAARRCAS